MEFNTSHPIIAFITHPYFSLFVMHVILYCIISCPVAEAKVLHLKSWNAKVAPYYLSQLDTLGQMCCHMQMRSAHW